MMIFLTGLIKMSIISIRISFIPNIINIIATTNVQHCYYNCFNGTTSWVWKNN